MVLIEDRRKDLIMTTKSVKKSTAKSVVKSAELVVTDRELEYSEIWAFVQEHAGGNEANVKIVPLDNVDLASATPVPFGYGGKTGGVRQVIQDWMLKGVDGDLSLKAVLNKAAPVSYTHLRANET